MFTFANRFCLAFAVTVVGTACGCGTPSVSPVLSRQRIVGGKEAVPHSSPWMVGIYRLGRHWCGGTLINDRWVVTAAHCLDGRHRRAVTPEDSTFFTVTLGDHRRSKSEGTEQIRAVSKIVMSPLFDLANVNKHDIALLRLSSPLTLNKYVQPACVVESSFPYTAGQQCIIVGWGSTLTSSDSDDVLRQATVPLISSQTCRSSSYYGNDYDPGTMVCAGYRRGGVDCCQRDSGGPLLCNDNGRWYLAGVTSWGYGCALPYKPGVYTKVAAYSDWIKGVVRDG